MLNVVVLQGRLTADPELKTVSESSISYCRFTLAVKRKIGDKTDFIDVSAFNRTAEFVSKHFSKGKLIFVIGKIRVDVVDGADGVRKYFTSVNCEEVGFCESKRPETEKPGDSEAESEFSF